MMQTIKIKHYFWLCLLFGMFGNSTGVWAGALDLSVSDEAAQIEYESAYDITDFYYSLGFLSFDTDNDGVNVEGTAWFIGFTLTEAVSAQSRVGLGAKIQQLSIDALVGDDLKGGALILGGYAHLFLPANEKLRFRAEAYFGPDAIAYDDISEYSEYSIQFEYNIIQNAVVILGYRQASVEVEMLEEDFDLDDNGFFGIRLEF